jgi:hypothetical protein
LAVKAAGVPGLGEAPNTESDPEGPADPGSFVVELPAQPTVIATVPVAVTGTSGI